MSYVVGSYKDAIIALSTRYYDQADQDGWAWTRVKGARIDLGCIMNKDVAVFDNRYSTMDEVQRIFGDTK